jgi:hypothetical protein
MNWIDIRKALKDAPHDFLLEIIKGLYKLSSENKAFIRTQLSPQGYQDAELLEKSRKKVIKAIYSEGVRGIPHMPRFGESRKIIRAYQKATNDPFGTIDLMLLHVERGTQFTVDFGDIDENFYIALETMLENTIDLLLESPNTGTLYEKFDQRFRALGQESCQIGWGYGDAVNEMIEDLQERMGDR